MKNKKSSARRSPSRKTGQCGALGVAPGSADWQAQVDALIEHTRSFVALPTDACVMTSLAAQVLLARPDRERLDWLDSVMVNANARNGTCYGWRFDINHNRAALTDNNIPALNIRDAIDAAMRAPNNEGEPCVRASTPVGALPNHP